MQRQDQQNMKKIIILSVIATVIIVAVLYMWLKPEPVNSPPNKPSPRQTQQKTLNQPAKEKKEAVIDYEKVQKDRISRETMEARKQRFGIDESLDMIVKSDESIKVGDVEIPMEEILGKIRLEEGELVETDIAGPGAQQENLPDRESLEEKMQIAETRYQTLRDKIMAKEGENPGAGEYHDYARLRDVLEDYENLQNMEKELKRTKDLLETKDEEQIRKKLQLDIDRLKQETQSLSRELKENEGISQEDTLAGYEDLQKRRKELQALLADENADPESEFYRKNRNEYVQTENLLEKMDALRAGKEEIKEKQEVLAQKDIRSALENRQNALENKHRILLGDLYQVVQPGKDGTVFYGIHVVKKGDNIWNIHFDFLREYFGTKGIRVSAREDEPKPSGLSSGVGKILKFSENMVHIYNLKDQKLGDNLDTIHPLSKIVVFNLGRALSLLRQIDYQKIDEVRFDGETLYIPAPS